MKKKFEKKQQKQLVILLVCIVTGFIIGYSYNLTKDNRQQNNSNMFYQSSNEYREELIEQQERNKQLQEELVAIESQIREYEEQFANDDLYEEQLKEANQIRLLLGESPAKGEGIRISLNDGKYDGTSNPNNYVVHESHIFSLIHELKIAGAEAIAINGKRLKVNSFISCNGPVITIDGQQFPAPFVIEAIGNTDTLRTALQIPGGMMDQLLMDNVVVELTEDDEITMQSTQQGHS